MTVHVDRAGTRQELPRAPSEQREMDADVRSYCADAGIEPPPPGREWWIVRPDGQSDSQFFAELNAFVIREVTEPGPVADREAVVVFLARVYP